MIVFIFIALLHIINVVNRFAKVKTKTTTTKKKKEKEVNETEGVAIR